ncbi:GSU2403 family nucleotidyltransferase fold protein [Candidatus Parabeggiatoa sp. HSG14]|uniref:GSU2403 family nucleotidyltransferase fold protein n=1 Tax=Candidatus Parabeggiatoa sp. HSG14 TaxID=3055593 RepID=UPI0025A82F87|nr:GSU2403 family nucleotidyltransferase fold protein [Thiotrichales bacterium HSG14]
MEIERLLESTNLLYSELLQQCWRAVPTGHGISFVTKKLKGKTYWYIQNTIGNQKTQYYLGVDSPELRKKIDAEKRLWNDAKPELKKRQKLVAMLSSAGDAVSINNSEARILELMERIGVFLVGGVLVGSHAFKLYSNMLGVRWQSEAARTFDIDVAKDYRFTVAIKNQKVDLKTALLESGMGMLEIPALNRKNPSTSFSIRGKQLNVDILTPMIGRTSENPIELKALKTYATPLRFLDFLLEDVQSAIVVAKAGILVNIPTPARYALHKLVISQRRPSAMHTKARKDILQAEQILSILIEDRPGDILLALEAVQSQPEKFRKQLRKGIEKLNSDLQAQFKREILEDISWW